MGTTILVSALTYALMRSFEAYAKIILTCYRDYKEAERKLEDEDERRKLRNV